MMMMPEYIFQKQQDAWNEVKYKRNKLEMEAPPFQKVMFFLVKLNL